MVIANSLSELQEPQVPDFSVLAKIFFFIISYNHEIPNSIIHVYIFQMADDALGMDVDDEEVELPSSSNSKGDRKRFEVKKV